MSRRPRIAAGLLAGALGAFLALAVASPAAAHSQVVATDPADGATLTSLPDEWSVTANEDLADLTGTGQGFALYVVGADGTKYQGKPITIDGPTMSTPSVALPPGDYELRYEIVSADPHPVSGSVRFRYAPGGAGAPTSGPTPTASASSASPAPAFTPAPSPAPSERPATAAGIQLAAWLVPLAVVVIVAAILAVVLLRRRSGR